MHPCKLGGTNEKKIGPSHYSPPMKLKPPHYAIINMFGGGGAIDYLTTKLGGGGGGSSGCNSGT